MNIEINGKTYPLTFGLRFLDTVDKERGFTADVEGMQMNTGAGGMSMLQQGLEVYSPTHLATVIRAATATERQKPSNQDIEKFIESLAENGDEYYDFYDDIKDEMGKNSILKMALSGGQRPSKK